MLAKRSRDLMQRLLQSEPAADDAVLLTQFAARRDEAAFAGLVRRHGPLVLGVCRRVAGHTQDAEDAFQAVFLVLARKAESLRQPDRLPAFLYGVACRIALRARRSARRRGIREVQMPSLPDRPIFHAEGSADLWPVLDREVSALPDWCRLPVILCDFHGAARADAARRLGIPEGTLSSRLHAGRKKLAARLTACGVSLSVLAAITPELTAAAVSASLIEQATHTALSGAAGTSVATLALYGSGPMRWKLLTLLAAMATGATTAGLVWAMQSPPEANPAPKPLGEVAKAPDDQAPKVHGKAALMDHKDFEGEIRRIEWAPSGSEFMISLARAENQAVGLSAGITIGRIQVQSNQKLNEISANTYPDDIHLFGYSQDGTRYFYAKQEKGLISGENQWIEVNIKDNKTVLSRPLDGTNLSIGRLSPDGKSILLNELPEDSKIDEASIRVFDIATGTLGPIKVTVPSRSMRFVADTHDHWVTLHGLNHREPLKSAPVVTMWDTAGKTLWTYHAGAPTSSEMRRRQVPGSIGGLHISADGSIVAFKAEGYPLTILDGRDGHELSNMERKNDAVNLYGLSANGRLLTGRVVESDDDPKRASIMEISLAIWDTSTGKIVKSWKTPNSSRLLVQFAREKTLLVVAEPLDRPSRNQDSLRRTRIGLWNLSGLVE